MIMLCRFNLFFVTFIPQIIPFKVSWPRTDVISTLTVDILRETKLYNWLII